MEQITAPADLYIAPLSRHVKAGEVIDVPEETAESLRALGWRSPETDKPKK